jgi:hypothetical protein
MQMIKRVRLCGLIGTCGEIERAYVAVWWGADGGRLRRWWWIHTLDDSVGMLVSAIMVGTLLSRLCHCSGECTPSGSFPKYV